MHEPPPARAPTPLVVPAEAALAPTPASSRSHPAAPAPPLVEVSSVAELRAALAARPGPVGLVPTMGYLHAGHASLARRARAENATVVMSLFVNPTQFGPNEDYTRYPRDLDRDRQVAAAAGVDLLWVPTVADL